MYVMCGAGMVPDVIKTQVHAYWRSHVWAAIKTYLAVFFKAIRSRCRCLHKINKFSPEAFGENKHVFACGASQLSFDIRASFFWSLPIHKQGRAVAVYV